jgi:hypothetical protein
MPDASADFHNILTRYQEAFQAKLHHEQLGGMDMLMAAFGLTPQDKAAASQYWGRELGMCWERLVCSCYAPLPSYEPGLAHATGQPCDFVYGRMAVDTKYRLGSGDAGTLKKLAENARWLKARKYEPVMLFLRTDSLASATSRMRRAGWQVLEAEESFELVKAHTARDLLAELQAVKDSYRFRA